jgi:BirA family biotin operon repressor/biotin-[acetyl-CoA-carboxylase] ligase
MSDSRPLLHAFDRVASTLDEIHRLAGQGAPDGTLVVAREQLAGRGTRGRTWYSPPGGLWLSLLCRPRESIAAEIMSIRAGLAVADALDSLGGVPPVWIKWPNDILVNDRKLGGVLCEARWQGGTLSYVAVGLGINVTNPLPEEIRATAIRLADLRPGLGPEALIEPLWTRLRALGPMGPSLTADELDEFHRRDWLAGRRLLEPAVGIARGIGADGALVVERPDAGTLALRAGHVRIVPGEE